MHPTSPFCCVGLIPQLHPAITEFVFDTTRAITSFLVNGTFSRYPDIRFVFCHSGGTLMPIAYRISGLPNRNPEMKAHMPNGVLHELKRLYLRMRHRVQPAGHRRPARARAAVAAPLRHRQSLRADRRRGDQRRRLQLHAEEAAAINRDNALRLFPRFRG